MLAETIYHNHVGMPIKQKKPFLQPPDIVKIEDLVERVFQCQTRIVYQRSPSNHFFFSSDQLNFKMQASPWAKNTIDFSKPMRAKPVQEFLIPIKKRKSVCKEHRLNLLTIPNAEVIQIQLLGKQQDLFVEEKLDLKDTCDQLSEDVNTELARQLAIFILNTGTRVNDLPQVKSKKPNSEKIKVGLINLPEMHSIYMSLFGKEKGQGLMYLFSSKEHIFIKEIENKLGISISLSLDKHIEPNFDNFPKSKRKLIQIAHELYKGITLKKNCDSILDNQKDTNTFFVNTNEEGPFLYADKLNLDTSKKSRDFPSTNEGNQEFNDATLIGIVSNEFIKHGLIKGVSRRDGHGWILAL